jgi:hypothetical protein
MTGISLRSKPSVCHVVKGEAVCGSEVDFGRFTAPELNLDGLVWPRSTPGPAFETPLAEILDVLVQTGRWLSSDPDGLVEETLESLVATSPLPRDLLERSYAELGLAFTRATMEFEVDQAFAGWDVLDGWRAVTMPDGARQRVRAFPTRLVHVIAGNAPGVAVQTVIRGALTKGVHLIKLPSNDLFTATLLLRALSAVAPGHPVARSFSAAYWRGGDAAVEGLLFRPQFFDKLVAWGGGNTIRNARAYIGPGFELVSFDPKTSISMIGREAFVSEETLADVAERAAADVTVMNQQACVASRFQFVEAGEGDADRFSALLHQRLGVERATCSARQPALSGELRSEVDALRDMEPFYRVWGESDGTGVVIRSDEPVDFHPDGRVVNVVCVRSLTEALRHANVATQTVGVFPPARRIELRDALASAGVQRVTDLGTAGEVKSGLPHDGFIPLQRFVRWVNDEA